MARNSRTTITVLLLGAVSASGYFLFQQYDSNVSALASASMTWPQVNGLVTRSELEYQRREVVKSRKTDFKVNVSYEYVVDGKVYENDIVRFDQQMLSTDRKQVLVGSYPTGKRVDVYYNPDDPGQSVLVRGSWSVST